MPATSSLGASASADGATLYREAIERLRDGDAGRATELLSEAVARRPDEVDYQLMLAEAYRRGGREEAALRLLELMIQRSKCELTANSGESQAASAGLKRAEEAARSMLGEMHCDAGRFAAGVMVMAPIEEKLPPRALGALATCLAGAGESAKARVVLQKAVERYPGERELWTELCERLVADRRFTAAIESVEQARKRAGDSPRLSWCAARAWFELGVLLGKVETRRVEHGEIGQFSREGLLIELGRVAGEFVCVPPESALYQVRRALDEGLEEPSARLLHARIWQRVGKPRLGFAILKASEALFSEEMRKEAYGVLAELALAADEYGEYLRVARRRAELDPPKRKAILGGAYVALAEKYNERGDEKMFVECLVRALEQDAENIELLVRCGDACWDVGRKEEAASAYREALRREPNHVQRERMVRKLGEVASP